jgi:xeroderma pigmentosum group C-complementing protein
MLSTARVWRHGIRKEPLKRVPYRAATTNRKRELAEAEHASGEKLLQGLYSWDQTDWIIPPPIENGVIPKNSFGNIDLYVESMLPEGAVHIPMRGTTKICKRLGIDYAEAVTGFEFGHRMAVPIITGVVVAEEHETAVMEEWHKEAAERVRKEDEKRRQTAVGMWRKMLMVLRIVEQVKEKYGDIAEDDDSWTNRRAKQADMDAEAQKRIMDQRDEEMAGGFLPEGFDAEEPESHYERHFFPGTHGHDVEDEAGGLVVEGHEGRLKPTFGQAYPTPRSLQSAPKSGTTYTSEEDVEMKDAEEESFSMDAPAPKKRGRPSGSANKSTNSKTSVQASTKGKAPAKRQPVQQKTPASGKRKIQIQDSEEEDSPLSELESEVSEPESDSEEVAMTATKKGTKVRRASVPAKSMGSSRKAPKRNAARKSETALRSHYFKHTDDEDDYE